MSDILVIEPNDDDEYAEEAELDGAEEVAEKPSKNYLMGITAGLIVSLVLIGETVGGLIGLNNYENLEFGQGVTAVAACDSQLSITPNAEPGAIGGEAGFQLESIDISNISDNCLNRTFTLSMYKSVGLGTAQGATIGTRTGGTPTNYIKFVLATQAADFNGLDWKIYPTSAGLPNPPSSSGLSTCGGDNNAIDNINIPTFDWTNNSNPGFGIVCPDDNFLTHYSGFIEFPGTDTGSLFDTTFTLRSTGNAELRIGNQLVISDRQTHSASNKTGSFSHRKGTSYSFDLWFFKGSGSGELKLSWNRGTDGEITLPAVPVPNSAFAFENTVQVIIPSGELPVNYTIIPLELMANNRSVRITLASGISTLDVDRFTIETSD